MVAEANFAFELNTALFHELDRLAGFGGGAGAGEAGAGQEAGGLGGGGAQAREPVAVPAPPDFGALAAAATAAAAAGAAGAAASSSAPSSPSAPSLGGCPFASLAKAGLPRPSHHPQVTSPHQKEAPAAAPAAAPASKCPFAVGLSLVDVAVVLVLVAAMLLAMPSASMKAAAGLRS
jgi:hypothetical protein